MNNSEQPVVLLHGPTASAEPAGHLEVPLPVCDECGEQVQVTCILA